MRKIYKQVCLSIYLVALILSLTGCQPGEIIYQPMPKIPVPMRPILPKVTADELSCVDDATYAKLEMRQRLLMQYVDRLRVLLGEDGAHESH